MHYSRQGTLFPPKSTVRDFAIKTYVAVLIRSPLLRRFPIVPTTYVSMEK